MKKLQLNPDELVVEPFTVEAGAIPTGTVAANEASQFCGTQPADSCGNPATCGGTSCDSGYPVCYQCSGVNVCD